VKLTKNGALKALNQLISSEPRLLSEGFHSFKFFEEDAEKGKDNFRKEMTGGNFIWKEFADACALLKSMGNVTAINKRCSGYGLKHLFEKKRAGICRMECSLPP
jgi:hypothetical protein